MLAVRLDTNYNSEHKEGNMKKVVIQKRKTENINQGSIDLECRLEKVAKDIKKLWSKKCSVINIILYISEQ